MKTSVKYEVIYRHREKYSISEMCRFFGVSRSGYYDYIRRMDVPAKDLPLAKAKDLIDDYIYFYNNQRIQTKTKLTPLKLRRQYVA